MASAPAQSITCNLFESVLGNDWIEEFVILKYSTHVLAAILKHFMQSNSTTKYSRYLLPLRKRLGSTIIDMGRLTL
jgi:hypothetical protein